MKGKGRGDWKMTATQTRQQHFAPKRKLLSYLTSPSHPGSRSDHPTVTCCQASYSPPPPQLLIPSMRGKGITRTERCWELPQPVSPEQCVVTDIRWSERWLLQNCLLWDLSESREGKVTVFNRVIEMVFDEFTLFSLDWPSLFSFAPQFCFVPVPSCLLLHEGTRAVGDIKENTKTEIFYRK